MKMAKVRIRVGRLIFVLIGGLTLVVGVFAAVYLLFGQEDEILTYNSMPIEGGYSYVVSDNYLTYATESQLWQVNLLNDSVTYSDFERGVDGFSVSSSMTACYAGADFHIRGFNGVTLTGPIRSVSAGLRYCAVLKTNSAGQDTIVIFTASGESVFEQIDFTDNKVVSFGFDTEDGRETLWVICVNVEAARPATTVRLYDYNNGGTMSYYPVFYDQGIEKLTFTEDSVFIIGTQDIIRYARSGSREQYRVGIYGKKVIDFRVSGENVYFLLQPRDSSASHTIYVIALAEADSANETSMALYSGESIISAFLQSGGIRVITPSRYISYSYSGKKSQDVVLEHPVDSVVELDNSRFLLTSGKDCYFVTINA